MRFGRIPNNPRGTVPLCDRRLMRPAIYPPFFHGPSFQVLEAAGPFAPESVALFRNPPEPQFGAGPAQFAASPMLVEAMFQACGLASLVNDKVMSLPAGIAKLESFVTGPLPADIRLRARPTGKDPNGNRTFDAEAVSGDGQLLLRLTGYAMVETGPVPAAAAEPAQPTGSPVSQPPTPQVSGDRRQAEVDAIPLPEVEDVHFAAVAVKGGPAEPDQFTTKELAQHKAFPVDKRRDEWRAGRLAAKKALQASIPGLSPTDVEIVGDDKGRPRAIVRGSESALWISISHRDGLAMAAVSPSAVGIDLEVPEDKPQSFLQEAFAVTELRSLLDAADPKVDTACLWAAKEAALKRAGVGLKADLRKHVVTPDGEGGATVEGPAVNGGYGVRFFMVDGKVLAVSAPACDPRMAKAALR